MTDGGIQSKVARVIVEYGLDDLGDEIERKWSAEGDERVSLRDLATLVNLRILESALDDQGQQSVEETVETTYRLLTDDETNPTSRTRIERDLERSGVDVEALRSDFVSHHAVHTYLTKHRGATPPTSDDDPIETAEQAINRLQSRTAAVTESNLERFARKGAIPGGDFEVLVSVEVICNACLTAGPVGDFLGGDGCECPAGD